MNPKKLDPTDDPRQIARFLRTLRVATQTALALDELTRGRGQGRLATTFSALAAKGVGQWRFPIAGLLSADGLVLARLSHEDADAKVLALQAQGATGLLTYADRAARVRLGATHWVEGVFDRDGRLHIVLEAHTLADDDLSVLEIELLDDTP
jgi:hypothetical protein